MDPRFRNVQPEFLAALYDHAPIEIHVWKVDRDPEGMITSWTLVHANPQALRTWSRTLADVVGKSNEELFPGADTTRLFLPVVQRIFSTSAPYEWEERFPETGQILKMTSIPLDDHFISCGVDVSDDRDVEAALSSTAIALDHSTRCLKIATEAAGIGIWEYLIGEESLVWDRSMYRIYGVEPTEDRIPYEVWRNGVHKDDIERATRDLNEAIASSKMFRSDFRIVRKDTGEVRYIAAQAIVEYDDDQQPVRMIGVNIDRTERRIAEQNVERLAFYDSLTDLPNRTLAERRLGRVIEEGARSGRWGALIFVDLDNFKQINDSVGHAVGDELLVAIAARLKGMTGPEHTAGRFGGDEFVVILDRIADDRNAASQHAEEFAGRLRQIIQEPVELSTGKQVASASIGVSVFSGAAAKAEDVFRQA
jgi:diguanylate cyclase (GGDEF)-like protein